MAARPGPGRSPRGRRPESLSQPAARWAERWLGLSLILWATATSWSAILESKKWATWLEGVRLLAMGVFFGVLGSTTVLPMSWAAAGVAVSALSLAWVATLGRTPQRSLATE